MITLQEILKARGFEPSARVKLVRHLTQNKKNDDSKNNQFDPNYLYRNDMAGFLKYQSAQGRRAYKDADYVVSCLGEDDNRARFIGVFKILALHKITGKNDKYWTCDKDKWYYEMEKVSGFEDIEERIIIQWRGRADLWFRKYDKPENQMDVVEISPGLDYNPFPGYLKINLSFNELKKIYENKYVEWKNALTAVYGVYVICDNNTGDLYIGSAYGENGGIWGRWNDYAKNGHGGNVSLKNLIKTDKNYANKYFKFSLLAIMPKSSTKQEVIDRETLYKNKFGTKMHGLNNN